MGGIKNVYQLISRYVQDDAMMMLPAASCLWFFFWFLRNFHIFPRGFEYIYSIYIYIPDISPHPGLGSTYVSYVYLILLIPSIRLEKGLKLYLFINTLVVTKLTVLRFNSARYIVGFIKLMFHIRVKRFLYKHRIPDNNLLLLFILNSIISCFEETKEENSNKLTIRLGH